MYKINAFAVDIELIKDVNTYGNNSNLDLNFEKYLINSGKKYSSHVVFGVFEESLNNLTKMVS